MKRTKLITTMLAMAMLGLVSCDNAGKNDSSLSSSSKGNTSSSVNSNSSSSKTSSSSGQSEFAKKIEYVTNLLKPYSDDAVTSKSGYLDSVSTSLDKTTYTKETIDSARLYDGTDTPVLVQTGSNASGESKQSMFSYPRMQQVYHDTDNLYILTKEDTDLDGTYSKKTKQTTKWRDSYYDTFFDLGVVTSLINKLELMSRYGESVGEINYVEGDTLLVSYKLNINEAGQTISSYESYDFTITDDKITSYDYVANESMKLPLLGMTTSEEVSGKINLGYDSITTFEGELWDPAEFDTDDSDDGDDTGRDTDPDTSVTE